MDEAIKVQFDSSDEALIALRKVFKEYQAKNKRKVEMSEIIARSENIDLLRKNLNLLRDE